MESLPRLNRSIRCIDFFVIYKLIVIILIQTVLCNDSVQLGTVGCIRSIATGQISCCILVRGCIAFPSTGIIIRIPTCSIRKKICIILQGFGIGRIFSEFSIDWVVILPAAVLKCSHVDRFSVIVPFDPEQIIVGSRS